MNYYFGLILLTACISFSWADDFRLSFSQEIIKAADRQPDDLDGLSLPEPEKLADPVPIPPKHEETSQPQASGADKANKIQEPPERRVKSAAQLYSARSKFVEPENKFLPIQAVPANHFLGQEMFAEKANLENDPLYGGGQNQMGIEPFDQLHDKMRLVVGEDIYAKMVWAYLDAKQLNDWIYAAVDQSELFAEDSLIVGLNDQLMAGLISLGLAEANNQKLLAPPQSNSRQIDMQSGVLSDEPQIDIVLMKADFESRSRFFGVLNYLTLENFLYLILSIVVLIYTGKLFKFLVRQQ